MLLVARGAEFFVALKDRSRSSALDVLLDARRSGMPLRAIVRDVVAPALEEVGRRWETAAWTPAEEHAASAVAEAAVAAISLATPRAVRGHVVLACVPDEWHALAARLAAEVLGEEGWGVTFLGPSLPDSVIGGFLARERPAAVALSVSVPAHLPQARDAIAAAHEAGCPVIVGGGGVRHRRADLAERLGAEAVGTDVDALVEILGGWETDGIPPMRQVPPRDPRDAALLRRRDALVTAVLDELPDRVPAVLNFSTAQLRATEEDVGHLVDAAVAAAFVDDPSLLREFATWLWTVLVARRADASLLTVSLQVLADAVTEIDADAGSLVHEARDALG